ncbi:SCO family protein [Paenibacillus baekrokdamisoli]|nr:SCO family protein [Paenibacillus baekrokdamisoli]
MKSLLAERKYVIAAVLLVLCMAAYWSYNSFKDSGKLPVVMNAPDFTIPDLDGKPVQYSRISGDVHMIEFMFTSCPDICPTTTYNFVQIQEQLKKQSLFGSSKVNFLAITFDPKNDTPKVLRNYASKLGMDLSGWTILRGEEAETINLAKKFGISVSKMPDGSFVHTNTSLLLLDGQQRVRKIYKMGEDMDNQVIMKDIIALQDEAAK